MSSFSRVEAYLHHDGQMYKPKLGKDSGAKAVKAVEISEQPLKSSLLFDGFSYDGGFVQVTKKDSLQNLGI
jgi:hypothetical protein